MNRPIKYKLFLFLSLLIFFSCSDDSTETPVSPWSVLGTRGFSDGEANSIAIDADSQGRPVIAYRDEANSGKLNVKMFDEDEWQTLGTEGGLTDSAVSHVCMDIYQDNIYVAYRDEGASPSGAVSVMKFSSGIWPYVGVSAALGGACTVPVVNDDIEYSYWSKRISISVFDDSTIFLAYIKSLPDDTGPNVFKYDGNSWTDITGALPVANQTNDVSIFAESASSVYIAYRENLNGYIWKYDASIWSAVGDNNGIFTVQGGKFFSLKVNGDTPYIAYSTIDGIEDTGSGNNTDPDRAVLKNYNGTIWNLTGEIISPRTATEITLDFCPNGNPIVCYMDWNGVGAPTVQKYNGTGWDILGESIIDAGTHFVCMAASGADVFVAFRENEGAYEGKLTVMKY